MVETPGFDWNGFYAGVHGTAQNGSASGLQYGLGVQAGVNAQFDFYLLGAEVAVSGLADNGTVGETTYGQILGRAGLVVSDNVAIYAAGGYGIDLGVTYPRASDVDVEDIGNGRTRTTVYRPDGVRIRAMPEARASERRPSSPQVSEPSSSTRVATLAGPPALPTTRLAPSSFANRPAENSSSTLAIPGWA